jgi:hypothetical protein
MLLVFTDWRTFSSSAIKIPLHASVGGEGIGGYWLFGVVVVVGVVVEGVEGVCVQRERSEQGGKGAVGVGVGVVVVVVVVGVVVVGVVGVVVEGVEGVCVQRERSEQGGKGAVGVWVSVGVVVVVVVGGSLVHGGFAMLGPVQSERLGSKTVIGPHIKRKTVCFPFRLKSTHLK